MAGDTVGRSLRRDCARPLPLFLLRDREVLTLTMIRVARDQSSARAESPLWQMTDLMMRSLGSGIPRSLKFS